jgi:hypothetical protein
VAQGVGPEFKPSTTKNKKSLICLYFWRISSLGVEFQTVSYLYTLKILIHSFLNYIASAEKSAVIFISYLFFV